MLHADSAMLQVRRAKPVVPGVVVGRLVDLLPDGRAVIDFPNNPYGPLTAQCTASISLRQLRQALEREGDVLITFVGGDALQPIVFDIVASPTRRRQTRKKLDEKPTINVPVATPTIRFGHIVEVREGIAYLSSDGIVGEPIPARTAAPLRNLTDQVLFLIAENGEAVIVGQILPAVVVQSPDAAAEVVLKGSVVRIEAEKELLLVAGGCKMQFDSRGRLVTTADQIVSRARGANKVQGGSVQLN